MGECKCTIFFFQFDIRTYERLFNVMGFEVKEIHAMEYILEFVVRVFAGNFFLCTFFFPPFPKDELISLDYFTYHVHV